MTDLAGDEAVEQAIAAAEHQRSLVVAGLVSALSDTMTPETMINTCVLRAGADPQFTEEMIDECISLLRGRLNQS